MQYPTHALTTVVLFLATAPVLRGADLDVPLGDVDGAPPHSMMSAYLMRQAEQAIRQWKDAYEKRKTPEEVAAYQKRLHEAFLNAIGGLPERTPLDAQVVGTVARPGYRVEKILFQSQPKFFVSALLFMPESERFKPPHPGVIVPCGHSREAKGHGDYQAIGALLAINGMAALVFDPIDQGERGQYLGKGGWPKLWGTAAHCNLGLGCVLLGQNVARIEVWDGMRAIDYLQSRPEIDPKRIGCTGNSGGGTQTSYLMALDDRIGAAAPSCYLTSTSRLLETYGVDDSEQQIFGQLACGLHEADFIMMRATSPVLMCTATHDFFDIQGCWETFRDAKRLYSRLGFSERVDLLENDAQHNYNTIQREGAARWMSRWLLGQDRPITEREINRLSEREYQCVPGGQVLTLPGARSAYDLNEDYENQLAKRRAAAWAGADRGLSQVLRQEATKMGLSPSAARATLLDQVRRLAGIRKLSQLPEPQVNTLGTVDGTAYKIQRLLLKPEKGIVLPALLFLPEKANAGSVVLYVHEQGKAADAGPGGPIEKLVQLGQPVLAVDLRGTGQTRSISRRWGGPEHQDSYLAYMLGRSCVGMRAEDVLVAARYAAQRVAGGRSASVRLIAVGKVGVPALHAAALEPDLFQSVKISRSLISWSKVIHSRLNQGLVINIVHGALTSYDLPDLEATLGNKLTVEEPVDAVGEVVSKDEKLDRAFETFVKTPTKANYLSACRILFQTKGYEPYSTELDDIEDMVRDDKFKEAQTRLKQVMPGLLLSPRVHFLAARVARRLGDATLAAEETSLGKKCLEGILSTGDGSAERAYIVTRVSDEYDVLRALKKVSNQQALIMKDSKTFDRIDCSGGGELWFDVTAPLNSMRQKQ